MSRITTNTPSGSGTHAASAGVGAAGLAANVDRKYRPDWWLFLATIILLSVGIVMVFDASYPNGIEKHADKAFWVKKQVVSAVLGLFGMFVASRIRFWKWQGWGTVFLVVSFVMLLAARYVGHKEMGGQRWIGYGPIHIQPSEFAKVALVLFLAQRLALYPQKITDFWKGFFPLIVVSLASVGLVERQPDLGTALTLLMTVILVLFAGGAKKRWIAGTLAVCALASVGLILHEGSKDNFRLNRLTAFMHPEADRQNTSFQITHSMVALGSGGLTGVGFGESREKRQGGLPVARTDFIFAIVGEEFGLAGTCLLLMGFVLLAARGFHIAQRTKDPFGSLLAVGITGMVSVQALLNIAVVTATLPTTGIPLPFISFGGSSLVTTLFGIGILLNISQHPFRRDMRPSARKQRGDADNGGSGSGKSGSIPAYRPAPVASARPASGGSAGVARARLLRYHEGTNV